MKKTIISLAIAAAIPSIAAAQSNLSMYGVACAALQYSAGTGNGNNLRLVSTAPNCSLIGFRGSEDLGGGLKATFNLEGGFNVDDASNLGGNTNNQASGAMPAGGLLFSRRSVVGLMGGFGEIRLGREYTPSFLNQVTYDPFGFNGVGSAANVQYASDFVWATRASNSINYSLPSSSPVYGHFMVALGENGSTAGATKNDGRLFSGRLGAAFGKADLSGAYSSAKLGTATQTDAAVGGAISFGSAKITGLVDQSKVTSGRKRQYALIGASMPVGAAGLVRGSFITGNEKNAAGTKTSDATQLAIGYVHSLSKRTSVFATASVLDNRSTFKNRTNARAINDNGGKGTAIELGLRHTF